MTKINRRMAIALAGASIIVAAAPLKPVLAADQSAANAT
jgi:hypothetical protein